MRRPACRWVLYLPCRSRNTNQGELTAPYTGKREKFSNCLPWCCCPRSLLVEGSVCIIVPTAARIIEPGVLVCGMHAHIRTSASKSALYFLPNRSSKSMSLSRLKLWNSMVFKLHLIHAENCRPSPLWSRLTLRKILLQLLCVLLGRSHQYRSLNNKKHGSYLVVVDLHSLQNRYLIEASNSGTVCPSKVT